MAIKLREGMENIVASMQALNLKPIIMRSLHCFNEPQSETASLAAKDSFKKDKVQLSAE